MSEENLTPWQKKHLEYQRRKAAENQEETEEPKKRKFLKKKEDDTVENAEDPDQDLEGQELEDGEELERTYSEASSGDSEDEEVKPSFFDGSFEVFKKMWPVLLIAVLLFIVSVYAVSPISKIGKFTVSGNKNESFEAIVDASKLRPTDRIYGVIRNRQGIEKSIVQQFPRVKAVELQITFPNNVEAKVTEFQTVAYVEQEGKNYQVLESGYVLRDEEIPKDKLSKLPLLKSFSDQEVEKFVTAYMKLKPEIRSLITTVSKAPTKATSDFLIIEMSDGNQVRVALSQIAEKMPYYTSVAGQLPPPQVIDMEAGIYAKSKEEYLNDLKNPEEEKKNSEDAAETATQ